MPVIALIILLALIVAAVGGGGLILALRVRSLLDISAASPWLVADCSVARGCPDSVYDTLTRQRTCQMQPSARPVYPSPWARLSPSAQAVYPQSLLL